MGAKKLRRQDVRPPLKQKIQQVIVEPIAPARAVAVVSEIQGHLRLIMGQRELQKVMYFRAGAHLQQALPQQNRQTAQHIGDLEVLSGEVDDDGDAVLIRERIAPGNLRLDMSQRGGGGEVLQVVLAGLQAQAEIAVIALPAEIVQYLHDIRVILHGPVQVIAEDLLHVVGHIHLEQVLVLNGEQNQVGEMLDGRILPGKDRRLQLVNADTALIVVLIPEIDIEDRIAALFRGIQVGAGRGERMEIGGFRLEVVDQVQRDDVLAGPRIAVPLEHAGSPVRAGDDMEIGIVHEDRILKNGDARLEHGVERVRVRHGVLQRLVPVAVFLEDILDERK